MDVAVESDLIVYMTLGKVREMGKPIELLQNPQGKFSRMVRASNPDLYQRLTMQLKKGSTSIKTR
jgi:ABC-type glutathione transport system ATPase component